MYLAQRLGEGKRGDEREVKGRGGIKFVRGLKEGGLNMDTPLLRFRTVYLSSGGP